MMRRKEKGKKKLPFLTWITEGGPLGAIERIKAKFVSKHHVIGDWGILIEDGAGKADVNQETIINWEPRNANVFP